MIMHNGKYFSKYYEYGAHITMKVCHQYILYFPINKTFGNNPTLLHLKYYNSVGLFGFECMCVTRVILLIRFN